MAESISPDNPPYLTLTISQALSLPPPPAPEPAQHESVNAMLDARARHMPDVLAVGFTHLSSGSWGCHTLTYSQIASLAHNLAGALEDRLPSRQANGKSPNGTPLVAVLSSSGLELFAHIVALWRLGYGVLCIAPGSTAESIANLLRLTETDTILAHASQASAAQSAIDALDAGGRVCEMLPDIQAFIDRKVDPKSGSATGEDVLVTMHTSGSSGLPKPIYQLHRFWTASMVTAPGSSLSAFTTTPLFHGGMSDLLRSIQAGSSIFFHPTADPGALSAAAICSAIAACPKPVSYFLSVPYILDLLFNDRSAQAREMLSGMELVSTGGAPLPQPLGDAMVHAGIKLVSRLGSSECGFLMSSWRSFHDLEWNFLRIPDELGRSMIRFEPFEGALFELVVAKDWPTKLVSNREDGAYATSDLYTKHPELENTWKYDSRADDTIVLVSGKKASAPIAERRLKESSLVTEAIAFGANRAIIGALVFVTPDAAPGAWNDEIKVKLLQMLQPVLKEINDASPPHAQLATEMVCLLPPSEAANIPRASKGTLQRGRAYQHYADLIDSVYLDFEEGRSLRLHSSSTAKEELSGEELVQWLQHTVASINGRSVAPDTDLFVAGVDSIQSARIRAAVHQNVELGGKLLDRNAVYEFPTLRLLAQHIEDVRSGSGGVNGVEERQEREVRLMRELVEKYSSSPPDLDVERKAGAGNGKGTLFLLTGVTGGLGAQVLAQVTATLEPEDTIACLIRASSPKHARMRLLDALSSRHLDAAHSAVSAESSQVLVLAADLSLPSCGLPPLTLSYARVLTIHAAWSVNFVASLSSFEAENIAGLSHLIALHQSLAGENGCFTFASSVASVLACPPGSVLHEKASTDPSDAVPMGYARSKWVAEQVVSRRFPEGGSRIVRIGQLCADTQKGVWNESEAWPLLIAISCRLGVFPRLQERLDWISTDVAAKSLLDISSAQKDGVFHVAQPTTGSDPAPSWEELHEWLQASELNLSLISPQEWLDRVAESDADHRGLLSLWQKNFTSPPTDPTKFDCNKALDASANFRTWQKTGVTQQLIQKTVARWKEIGFLS
ncbi:Acyl carrier protein-like protein [Kalmanozyma brasiliensis GHG001]|uniref:Carrier domain-containing protein n=1 Tax=Kalmanozyma brasiliensis (strain GHG001) TaxID=1365824 RepID=V5E5T2_KALBG|nr:Acyl carrier protein-like protein [Kalmanozyma brasiliensis GHG001]EST05556.1 Acyl carrier protein-like protein [Kalmanozyma brasiliensis GHG001]